MKYPNVPGCNNMSLNGSNSGDDMDSLFSTTCWQNSSNDFMDTNKLLLDEAVSSLGPDKLLLDASIQDENDMNSKDAFSAMFSSHFDTSPNLTEMKPLPPFTGYTANLSINGIQGHHYHTISQRIDEENNNYNAFNEQNIVSSSTCNINADSAGGEDFTNIYTTMDDVVQLGYENCVNPDSVTSPIKFDECTNATVADSATQLKNELFDCYDTPDVHIAHIMTNAAADSTVRNSVPNSVLSNTVVNSVANTCGNNIVNTISNNSLEDPNLSKDSWNQINDWDYFIQDKDEGNITDCLLTNATNSDYVKSQSMADYATTSGKTHQQQQPQPSGSTLQSLLTHTSNMPLLQYRLENGPPMKQDTPTSSNYVSDHISTSSPPANVGSTTDSVLLRVNGQHTQWTQYTLLPDDHRNQSPELLSGPNYPHTTTSSTPTPVKKPRRTPKKQQQQPSQQQQQQAAYNEHAARAANKERPLHRCNVCNRGFLNKSNIKVHLRTHTGEKPFRCDTCAKAFRQKAHLLKHQQIHKRGNRD